MNRKIPDDQLSRVAKIIDESGQKYRDSFLNNQYNTKVLLTDWWESRGFFFDHAFFQGRYDEISTRVRDLAEEVMSWSRDRIESSFSERDWSWLATQLALKIGKGKIGKGGDIKMVISTLSYLNEIKDRNIVQLSVTEIHSKDLFRHWYGLNSLYQVKDKVASFYLRDVVSLFQLDKEIPDDFQINLQPVDTWVKQKSIEIGLANAESSPKEIKQAILKFCKPRKLSAIKFNQGLWYVGKHKVDLSIN